MIKLDQIVAVSSKPGLYKAITSKSNGLILEELGTGKNSFFSGRLYQFSLLDSMGLYTTSGTMPLKDVYEIFLSKEAEVNIPDDKAKDDELKSFFINVIPSYDQYRVHPRDMKKCLRWYHQLKTFQLISPDSNVQE